MACLFIYLFYFYYHVFTGIVWCYYYYSYYYYYYHYILTKYFLVIFLSSMSSVPCSRCFLCQEPECLVALEALATHVYSSCIHRYIFTGIIRPLLLWLEARVPSGSSGILVLTAFCRRLAVTVAPWARS